MKHLEMHVVFSTLFSVFHLEIKHYIPCFIYYVKTQPTAIDAEVWVSSSPFKEKAKVKSPSFTSVTRNSHLTNRHEADSVLIFFFQGVLWGCSRDVPECSGSVPGCFGPVLGFTDTRGNSGLTWQQILSTTHVRCVCLSAFKRNALTSRQNLLEWDMITVTAPNYLKADKLTMGWS